jgi:DNA-binding transcriptional MerR regulator
MSEECDMSGADFLTTAAVARELGVSEARVRQLANAGRLPTRRTVAGHRLYSQDDVARFRSERRSHPHA